MTRAEMLEVELDREFISVHGQRDNPTEYHILKAHWDSMGVTEEDQQLRLTELRSVDRLQRASDDRYHSRTIAVGRAETAESIGLKQTMSNRYGHKVKQGNKLTGVRGKRNGRGDMI